MKKPRQMGSYIKDHKAMMKHKLKNTMKNSKKQISERKSSLDYKI